METSELKALGLIAPARRHAIPAGPQTVARILDNAIATRSDRLALKGPEASYTYAELDQAVNGACHYLHGKGLAPGDRIAASMKNGCDIVIAFLAAQRLGLVWVGINAILPVREKTFILQHSGARLLLADGAVAGEIESVNEGIPDMKEVIRIEADTSWMSALSTPAPALSLPEPDPFAPATIMYTSGTTGTPKGVVHSQHNMLVVAAAFSSHGLLSPNARRGVVLPLTITNVMILGPLMAFWNGQTCVCGTTAKTHQMVEWLNAEGIQTFSAVPTMVYDILQADVDLPGDLQMGSGGAPLPDPVKRAFAERHGRNLLQSYGLTEAPTVVTESRGQEVPEGASGLAAPHLEVTIRDAEGDLCPPGTIGEICISATTEGVWAHVYTPPLGYWKDRAKSAALLAGGVVHTGDVGRFDENGWLYVADRGSELILRGGSNVYPAEVERVLYTHGCVADCAVVGKPDLRLGNLTIAFIQAVPGSEIDKLRDELLALCRENLAKYKTPDEWRFVDQFPRNAMGKIVKPRLRELLAAEIST